MNKPIRLWYQSATRADAWGPYYKSLRRIVDEVKDAGTEIEIHGITGLGGLGKQMRYLDYLETGEILENVARAQREGFDAFLIGHFSDSGIREARELVDMPVLGLCESAIHIACIMGANFSLVAVNEKGAQRNIEKIEGYGLRDRLVAINRMQMNRTLDLNRGFTDRRARDRIVQQFLEAANANVEAGAEVVISSGGVVMALLAEAGVYQADRGTPILNGIVALVKMAEMSVKLNRIMGGTFVSKRLAYAPPGLDQINEIRKYYGAGVYPGIKGRPPRSK